MTTVPRLLPRTLPFFTRGEPRRGWLAVAIVVGVVVCSSLAGVGAAANLKLAALPIAALLVVPLLASPKFRLVFVIFGGLATLQTSEGLTLPKIGYLVGVCLILGMAVHESNSRKIFRLEQEFKRVANTFRVFSIAVACSALVAAINGVTVGNILRDAAPYLLFAFTPILALHFYANMRPKVIQLIFILAGLLGSVSFAAEWLSRRNLIDMNIERFMLPSLLLPAAMFCYAVSAALLSRRNRALWTLLVTISGSLLLITGTRSALLLLTVVPFVALWTQGSKIKKIGKLIGLSCIGIVLVVSSTLLLANVIDVNVSRVTERFLSIGDAVQSPGSDYSYSERVIQTRIAWSAFVASPAFGSGLGQTFEWQSPWRASATSFNIDSPLVFPAKFGLLGVAAMTAIAIGLVAFMAKSKWDERLTVPHVASWAYLLFIGELMFLISPFEDKGLSFGLLFLFTLLLAKPYELEPGVVECVSVVRGTSRAQELLVKRRLRVKHV